MIEETEQKYIDELLQLLSIPSISKDKPKVLECANWIQNYISKTATSVELIETDHNPLIIAYWKSESEITPQKTLLIYGHYDVQPLSKNHTEKWITPPFQPTIRDGRIFARGAGDNKGQFFAYLCAIDTVIRDHSSVPIDIKLILDGDEEMGSPFLLEGMRKRPDFFSNIDVCVVSDGPANSLWKPSLELGVRGIMKLKMHLQTGKTDVHSGNFGGIQSNPAWDLIKILATMRNENGTCLIDGFYDDLFELPEGFIDSAGELNRMFGGFQKELELPYFGGEQNCSILEKVLLRPTFNILGFTSGNVGHDSRNIVPHVADVEIDIRLVPHQTSDKIEKLIRNHLQKLQKNKIYAQILSNCKIDITSFEDPYTTPLDNVYFKPIYRALQIGFGEDPVVFPIAGGTLPLDPLFKMIKCPIYCLPYAQPDENNHAPNENISIEWFIKGIKTSLALFDELVKNPELKPQKKGPICTIF
ncbi:Succinyl-diaminopimelate desuccinylase [subsurface metagenome]